MGRSLAFGGLLVVVAARLLWCGSIMAAAVGTALLPLYAMSLAGRRPYILDAISFTASLVVYGKRGLVSYGAQRVHFLRSTVRPVKLRDSDRVAVGDWRRVQSAVRPRQSRRGEVGERNAFPCRSTQACRGWSATKSRSGRRCFCSRLAWVAVGLLRPALTPLPEKADIARTAEPVDLFEAVPESLYLACEYTLFVVVLIYAGYLAFEFHTLWFRVFPPGFYYSGYAHEGAAWLTIGLAR